MLSPFILRVENQFASLIERKKNPRESLQLIFFVCFATQLAKGRMLAERGLFGNFHNKIGDGAQSLPLGLMITKLISLPRS
jgi:hypothetical protein